ADRADRPADADSTAMTTNAAVTRFRDRSMTFRNGVTGRTLDVPSASPLNYYQALSAPAEMPRTQIDGQLFAPPGARPPTGWPLVIVVPGSLGVDETHLAHAEALTAAGLAAFVLDAFGARGVTSTVTI